jgi:hypothetical protein
MACTARVLLVAALTTPLAAYQPAPDASQVLADMRQALGGDALKTIETFSVKGSEDRLIGRSTLNAKVEWAGILPDRFIEERSVPQGSVIISMGFNADAPVRWMIGGTSRGRGRFPFSAEPAVLPEASRHNVLILAKRHFSRITVAMFGITSIYPLDAIYISRETLDRRPVHLLELRGPDDYVARLCVDVSSHLPRMVSWMAANPIFLRVPGTAPDTSMVEHRLYFSKYEKRDGLNWPHRITEVVGTQTVVETRLGKFKINSKIDPKLFEPLR